jgi:hypothetical protein
MELDERLFPHAVCVSVDNSIQFAFPESRLASRKRRFTPFRVSGILDTIPQPLFWRR